MKKHKKILTYLASLAFVAAITSEAQTPGTLKWSYAATTAITSSGAALDANQTAYFSDYQHTMYAINSDGSVKWTVSAPSGYYTSDNSPALGNDGQTIYYVIANNNASSEVSGITARSVTDGSERWTYYCTSNSSGINTTLTGPAIGPDGSIYVNSGGGIYALTSSGALEWSKPFSNYAYEPAVGPDGTIYVGVNGQGLYGFNPDGSQKVLCLTDGGAVNSPSFAADGTIYVGGYGGLYAFNPDGTRKWKYSNTSLQAQFPARNGAPVDPNGVIYFQCRGYLYAINPDGTLKWQFSTENTEQVSYDSCPAIAADGTIYVGSSSHKLYAVNPDGALLWSYTTGNKIYSPIAIGSDGTVYVGGLDANFYAFYGSAPLETSSSWPKFHRDFNNSGNAGLILPAPSAPTGVSAAPGNTQVVLNWSSSAGATSYNVKLATVNGGPYTTITSSTLTSYTNTGLPNGVTLYYVISAVNGSGESADSTQVSAVPNPPPPPTPINLAATPASSQVTLKWYASSGATSYHVKRSTTSGGPYTTVASPTSTNYVNTGLINGTTYYYVVSAVNSYGESLNSSEVNATPQPLAPPAPGGLTATAGVQKITLKWNAAARATSYNVKSSTTSGGPYTIIASPTSLSYTNTGLTSGVRYYYVVSAINGGGESPNSSQVSAVSK